MSDTTWKGTRGMKLAANCPIFLHDRNGPRFVMIFRGDYGAMSGNLPQRGSIIPGVPAEYVVDRVRLEKDLEGRGLMTVICPPTSRVLANRLDCDPMNQRPIVTSN